MRAHPRRERPAQPSPAQPSAARAAQPGQPACPGLPTLGEREGGWHGCTPSLPCPPALSSLAPLNPTHLGCGSAPLECHLEEDHAAEKRRAPLPPGRPPPPPLPPPPRPAAKPFSPGPSARLNFFSAERMVPNMPCTCSSQPGRQADGQRSGHRQAPSSSSSSSRSSRSSRSSSSSRGGQQGRQDVGESEAEKPRAGRR